MNYGVLILFDQIILSKTPNFSFVLIILDTMPNLNIDSNYYV